MGIATGFIVGAGITGSFVSFTLLQHRRNREQQSRLLRQQALLVKSLIDPRIVPEEDAPRMTGHRDEWTREWKDRWNTGIEDTIRWCNTLHWNDIQNNIMTKVDQVRDDMKRA